MFMTSEEVYNKYITEDGVNPFTSNKRLLEKTIKNHIVRGKVEIKKKIEMTSINNNKFAIKEDRSEYSFKNSDKN